MKRAQDVAKACFKKGLGAVLATVGIVAITCPPAIAEATPEPAAPTKARRPRVVVAEQQIDVQIIEVPQDGNQPIDLPQGGNPLRLLVTPRSSDAANAPDAQPAENMRAAEGMRLGVALAKVPDAVRAQIDAADLPAGFGVMVQEVAPGSPAAEAGLEAFDILAKFDDQKLISGEQLVALVNAVDNSRPVAITLLRKGRRKVVKVRLAETAGGAAAAKKAATKNDDQLADAPKPEPAIPGLPGIANLPPQIQDLLKQLPEAGLQMFGGDGGPIQANVSVQSSTVMATDRGTITITDSNGSRTVTIQDKAGNAIFSGPLNTADYWEQIPDAFRNQLPKP